MKNISIKTKVVKKIVIFIITLCIILSFISIIYIKINYDHSFSRVELPNPKFSAYLNYSDVNEYPRKDIEFKSGSNILKGHIYGDENSKGLIVISHGLGLGSVNYLAETIYFVKNGWKVVSYDNTGTHNSTGTSTVGPSQSLFDLMSALSFINSNNELNSLPLMLYGHSWGAYAVTAILNYDFDIKAVVSVSGFNSSMELLTEQVDSQLGVFSSLLYPFLWIHQKLLFEDFVDISAINGINKSNIPVMIIHGNNDESISYDGSSIIAHRNEINNPNVVLITRDKINQNGHNNLFESNETIEYIQIKNLEYKELFDQYNGDIPDDVKENYYKTIDRFKTSSLDDDFMHTIHAFFESKID